MQEYTLANGCAEVSVDSVVRRPVDPDSMRVQKNWATDGATRSGAATVYAHYSNPVLDSAKRAACSNRKILRRIDAVPRVSVYTTPEGTDLSLESPIPVDTDSVYVCMTGDGCSKVATRRVRNVEDYEPCLTGALAPFRAPEEALAFLQNRLRAAVRVERLRRQYIPRILYDIVCLPLAIEPDPVAARTASLAPVTIKEDRFSFSVSRQDIFDLPAVDWAHSSISPRLALPSGANAGDRHGHDSLIYIGSPLDDSSRITRYSYTNGVERYIYRGLDRWANECADTGSLSAPLLIDDSLRLEGPTLELTTGSSCAAPGIDNYADDYRDWLYAPLDGDFQKNFAHSVSAETQTSWPIVNDSVQIRGQKIALTALRTFVATLPRENRVAPLAARALDGALWVTIDQAATVRLSSPDGRILSASIQPAGTSRIELPRGHHGILLVDDGFRSMRAMVP